MLVKILITFDDTNGVRRLAGDNPDVDPAVARSWISDGYAIADIDGVVDIPLTATRQPDGSLALTSEAAASVVGAIQDAGIGGVTWIEDGGVVVGMEGPNGQQFAVLQRNVDGSISATIIPRSGDLATLLPLAGGVGEVSTDPATGALVLHTGVAGEARPAWTKSGGATTVNVTGTGAVAMAQLPSYYKVINITKDAGVTAITLAGWMTDGSFDGEQVNIVNKTGISIGLSTDGSTLAFSLLNNHSAVFEWSSGSWHIVRTQKTDGYGGVQLGVGGEASGPLSLSLHGGKATATRAIALGNSAVASATSALALGDGKAEATYSFALSGTARRTRSVAFPGATARWDSALALFFSLYGGGDYIAESSDTLLSNSTIGAGATGVLTTDGLPATAYNSVGAAGFVGAYVLEITITLIDYIANLFRVCKRLVQVSSDGANLTVGSVIVVSDLGDAGLPVPVITFGVNATFQTLAITCTTPAGHDCDWVAKVTATGSVVA